MESLCTACIYVKSCSYSHKDNVATCEKYEKKLALECNQNADIIGILDKSKLLIELKEIKENAEAAIELCHDNKNELGIDYKYMLEHSIIAKEKAGMLIRILENPKPEKKWIYM